EAASGLDQLATRVVEVAERYGDVPCRHELVDGLPRPLPVAIVIDLDNPTRTDPVVEVRQTHLHAVVPVAIEMQHHDGTDVRAAPASFSASPISAALPPRAVPHSTTSPGMPRAVTRLTAAWRPRRRVFPDMV